MSRPDINSYMLSLAMLASSRATCCRRSVGCVLTDKHNHIIATGYNGVAAGRPHCVDVPCPGANAPSGQSLDLCQALHAEQNALLQCRDMYAIHTAYVTASPCVTCTKLLLNTSCRAVFFLDEYPHADAKKMWIEDGRIWAQAPMSIRLQVKDMFQVASGALSIRSGQAN